MNIPVCPNFRQNVCEQSDLRLAGENSQSFVFTCATCNLTWCVTKDKTREKGRWEAQMRKVQEASTRERELATRKAYSIPCR